jgi:hypothetical protein
MPQLPSSLSPLHSPLACDPIQHELVELFVEEMPARLARLQKCFDGCDWHALRVAVRHLSETACNHGFDQLLPYTARMEAKLTRRAPTPEVREALEALLAQCNRLTADAAPY